MQSMYIVNITKEDKDYIEKILKGFYFYITEINFYDTDKLVLDSKIPPAKITMLNLKFSDRIVTNKLLTKPRI